MLARKQCLPCETRAPRGRKCPALAFPGYRTGNWPPGRLWPVACVRWPGNDVNWLHWRLTPVNGRYMILRMGRSRHSDKHIERAVQYAETLGWRVVLSNGHAWGR